MIICPKPLVTERKWETEMKRFDEDFVPLTGPELRQVISDTDRDGEWPVRYSKTIVPYSILDSRTYEGDTSKKSKFFGLKDLDPAPHFDLVIIDEAHHIRNGSMEKEKAFEYKCVKYFCDHADAVVMLTATPLQTSDDDLFTLLNVLRPDVVIDKQTFNLMSRPNAHISQVSSLIRRAGENWQQEALEELKGVLETQWGENVVAANPTYSSMVQTLQQDKITREERVKLITDAESLHSFNSMLNRTRRKAIVENIERVHGQAAGFLLMAPTGKAAERIKTQTDKNSSTIHSFLASNGWLNKNFTLKRVGGGKGQDVNTIIIDECSMIDLNLFATLLRSINWNSVQRLILVGDPNQLPPIGISKFSIGSSFYDFPTIEVNTGLSLL